MKALFTYLLLFVSLISFKLAFGQSRQVYMQRDFEWKYQQYLSKKDVKNHDAIKPYLLSDFEKFSSADSNFRYKNGFPFRSDNNTKPDAKGRFMMYPLVDLSFVFESSDSSQVASQMGIGAGGLFEYGNNISAQLNVSGHQNQYPSFLTSDIIRLNKVPEGMIWHTETGGYNYVDVNGYFSWNANEYINLQVGRGNHFIGNGYRSLLLSENAGNYNYGRLAVDIWRIKYAVIYAHMKDVNNTDSRQYGNFRDKFTTTHFLDWNLTKWLNIGIFESVVWKASDTLLTRGFDVHYLNPVIFFRPVEFSTGSSDNSIMGLNFSVKPTDGWQIYGQFVLDEFLLKEISKDLKAIGNPNSEDDTGWWANKYGWQLGTKAFNLFGVEKLGIQTEFNFMRPFTFSHKDPIQNYGHQNSPIAHPFGANFMESASFLNYRYKNWFFEGSLKYAYRGLSTDSLNAGEDIYRSYDERDNEYGHYTGQGLQNHTISMGLRSSYLIFPESNLRFNLGVNYRVDRLQGSQSDGIYLQMGISTSFKNAFFDI